MTLATLLSSSSPPSTLRSFMKLTRFMECHIRIEYQGKTIVHSLQFSARLWLSDARRKSCCLCSNLMIYIAYSQAISWSCRIDVVTKEDALDFLQSEENRQKTNEWYATSVQQNDCRVNIMPLLSLVLFKFSMDVLLEMIWYNSTTCFYWTSENYSLWLLLVHSYWTHAFLCCICNGHCVSETAWYRLWADCLLNSRATHL